MSFSQIVMQRQCFLGSGFDLDHRIRRPHLKPGSEMISVGQCCISQRVVGVFNNRLFEVFNSRMKTFDSKLARVKTSLQVESMCRWIVLVSLTYRPLLWLT